MHFMHPQRMPIMDVRTIGVLLMARLISTERKDLAHYDGDNRHDFSHSHIHRFRRHRQWRVVIHSVLRRPEDVPTSTG